MAAYIVRPNKAEWAVLEKILTQCQEGAIIIPPAMQEWLAEYQVKAKAGSLVEYDFGGEADVSLDVLSSPEHNALYALDHDLAERIGTHGAHDPLDSSEAIEN